MTDIIYHPLPGTMRGADWGSNPGKGELERVQVFTEKDDAVWARLQWVQRGVRSARVFPRHICVDGLHLQFHVLVVRKVKP